MSELIAALNQLEKEKGIDKDVIMEAIENSLLAACKRDFGSADNVVVNMDRETGDIYVYAIKEVVDEVYDPALEISLGKAKAIDQNLNLGDTVRIEITLEKYTGVKLEMSYKMINAETGAEVFEACSSHCFIGSGGRPAAVKKFFPEFDRALREICSG